MNARVQCLRNNSQEKCEGFVQAAEIMVANPHLCSVIANESFPNGHKLLKAINLV